MHEISLVKNIFSLLEENFPGRTGHISTIHLKAGLLSNVQPVLMQNAFSAVQLEEPTYAGIKLEVEVLPILIYCEYCNKNVEVHNYTFVCNCGKPSSNIVQGEELMIDKLEFRD